MSSGYHIIEDALLNKKTSRLPCFPLIDSAFAAAYFKKPLREVQLNPRLHADALCACAEELPVDGVYINLGLTSGQAVQLTESTYRIDDSVTLLIPANDVLSISKTDIKSLEDERFESADLFHPGILETFRSMNEKVKENYAVVVGLTGTFSQVAFLYGISEILMALLDQPDAVRETLARRHKIAVQQAREICATGPRFIWIGEGLGSGSLISPNQYREFVLPYEQDLAEEIRKAGVLSILHICGNVTSALPDIARCGADGFDLDYPYPAGTKTPAGMKTPVDLQAALDTLLPQVAVKGNVNPTLFLPGREEALRQACAEAKKVAGKRNGFIMSTGCLVPRDAAEGSFQIMAQLCSNK